MLANEDLEVKVSNFYTRIKEPALTNLRLEFSGGVRASKMYPAALPDLFKGDQLVLAGRYTGSGEVEAKLTGMAAGREQTFTYKVRFEDRTPTNDFVPRLGQRAGWDFCSMKFASTVRQRTARRGDGVGAQIWNRHALHRLSDCRRRRAAQCASRCEIVARNERRNSRALDSVAKAWAGFKDKKEGDDGVANARSQNFFKYAEQRWSIHRSRARRSRRADWWRLLQPLARSRNASRNTHSSRSS